MMRRLICAECGKEITVNDYWVMVDDKPYHIGCLMKKRIREEKKGSSGSSNPGKEVEIVKPEYIH